MKWLYRKSRWIHKYIGLFVIIFVIWMSISGILLNHPEMIADISVPKWLTPAQYSFNNWNRSAIIQAQFSQKTPGLAYFAGKAGIWKTENDGDTFAAAMQGMPAADFYRKTYSILLLEDRNALLAGTEKGLFWCDLSDEIWHEINLKDGFVPVKKILETEENIIVFSDSEVYISPGNLKEFKFRKIDLLKEKKEEDVSLVRLFFDLHSGKIWGLPGQIIWDIAGLIIIFLAISAFYIWFKPRKEKRGLEKKISKGLFLKYHNKLGIISAVILIFVSFTAIFMRPPLLAIIAGGKVPGFAYPAFEKPGPWHKKIKNALWSQESREIIISDDDGFWVGKDDLSSQFRQTSFNSTVFVMGTTVFEKQSDGNFVIGSFAGLFSENSNGEVIDLLTGKNAEEKSRVRPGEIMVTGYFKNSQGEEYLTAHEQGLVPLRGTGAGSDKYKMPAKIADDYRMPLWNFLFELHNGRIFKDFIGGFYLLLVPLLSILFFLVVVSGTIDWFYYKIKR